MGDEVVATFAVSDDYQNDIAVYKVARFEVFNPWEADSPATFVHEEDARVWAKKLAKQIAKRQGFR